MKISLILSSSILRPKLSDSYGKTFRIVIPNPSRVIPSEARNLVFSGEDCHVALLLAMTALKKSLNLGYMLAVILKDHGIY